jgi:hypothetical protein
MCERVYNKANLMLLAYSKERGLRSRHRVNTLAASLGILYERKTQLKEKSDRTG